MAENQRVLTDVAKMLHGVQHFGITVDNMEQSLEFYIDLLGGELAVGGQGFAGEPLHNNLFQIEDLDAIESGVHPKTIGVPDLRSGADEALDVNFIWYGNVCIELIYYRDAKANPRESRPFAPSHPTSTAYVISSHLSFHVKDEVEIGEFAQLLESESHKRGMHKVRCNRIITVKSEAERQRASTKDSAYRFWHDPDTNGADFGDFYGWALFYAKGPSGEQLEFNQATRQVKVKFEEAKQRFSQARISQ
jgi:catechol 2,3-dioxygenase-like lactoylglutathione lyase family enzyme